ncbi:hypothetical protein ACHQM5_003724 [Ranunculus cassubicifolius]
MVRLITPTTIQEMKKTPPRTLLSPTPLVPSPMKETKLENTSFDPLPMERRVTPTIVGESFKALDKFSKEEQK